MANSRTISSVYTDGACSGNPGSGGWGVVICYADGSIHELGGSDSATTNNRMEMQAALAALEFFAESRQSDPVTIYTDSEYLIKGITQWIKGWKKKGWLTSNGKPVLNRDLWESLDRLNSPKIRWQHVRGHSGNLYNDRCDAIARAFSVGQTPSLKQLPLTSEISSEVTHDQDNKKIQSSSVSPQLLTSELTMTDSNAPFAAESESVPRELRVAQLRDLVETLRIADEIAQKRYLIASSELADLMDVNASAVTSRGDNWVWRNWIVSRVRREGNQILWQLERID
ncbi:MAG: ribonuclease HI [Oscillatoriaceae bacterium SKW80]|nr:ribonuclease HI [Oscillatoriaceae bacterium SKYG93]MCX8121370.1 ribonuclease HI [Oscillatoriaceae bacterium SKW80]MDW8451953.1 ribonuclease HI [Oscillatoriaceae cyanobacterium SKYGB_i_bin93]HIK29496.1 ribonuclease HI [Oscillatoriaceae cyanobacterium M7585_C2015_266]